MQRPGRLDSFHRPGFKASQIVQQRQEGIAFEAKVTRIDTDKTRYLSLTGKLRESIILKAFKIGLSYPGLLRGSLERVAKFFASLF